jgi:3-hydroxyisobutyrate dehydrogenase-like beta-hydroxyacid dehydrogenase
MGNESIKVGILGLGIMGQGMAKNLLAKGFALTVWNRSTERTRDLEAHGATVARTPRELAESVDYVITSLADPTAVRSVALGPDGLLAGAKRGLRWIETSTIGPGTSLELGAAAEEQGVEYLEATLLIMTGGSQDLHKACLPVMSAISAKQIHVGLLGTAAIMKLIGNTILSFMLEGLAEGAVLGARAGVSLEKILEVVQASGFASPYWAFKGGAMAARDFDTHFSLDLLHKDQALMLAEGAARNVPLPGLATIHQVTSMARALGYGAEDIAAQIRAVETAAGVEQD